MLEKNGDKLPGDTHKPAPSTAAPSTQTGNPSGNPNHDLTEKKQKPKKEKTISQEASELVKKGGLKVTEVRGLDATLKADGVCLG